MELCTTEIVQALHSERKFIGAFPSNRIPTKKLRPPYGIIVNCDRDDQPGSHWVAIYVTPNGHGEYFDSFGREPFVKEIVDFLVLQDVCFCCSSVVIQHPASAACGFFSIGFLLARFRSISFEKYLSTFDADDLRANDNQILKWTSTLATGNSKKFVRSLTLKASRSAVPMKNHASCQWSYQS